MTRDEVLKRFCRLSTTVASNVFDSRHASDCFCEQSAPIQADALHFFTMLGMGEYRFSEEVLLFIEAAVADAMRNRPPITIDAEDVSNRRLTDSTDRKQPRGRPS